VGDFYESNQEFEFEVSDPEAFKVFCQEFGFQVLIEKNKRVQKYLYLPPKKEFALPVIIELNQVEGLGNFIEIETIVKRKAQISKASQFLKSLLKKLGMPLSKIEPIPYTEMLYRKRHGRLTNKRPHRHN
jgi:adenylate cyclase class 2